MKQLVIVESPAKAKTITSYLKDSNYCVLASYGHVRDIKSENNAVDPEQDFKIKWEVQSKYLSIIKKSAENVDQILLATDSDREGEAISWHILEEINKSRKLKHIPIKRIVFQSITKQTINDAINNPREVDLNLVHSYLARRVLDYLFGFTLSPVLWKKLPSCRSAGRVQSVVLKLICERENEIINFTKQEYWSVPVQLNKINDTQIFLAKLTKLNGKKIDKLTITNQEQAEQAKKIINNCDVLVLDIKTKIINQRPFAPLTTSKLQQEAINKLRFTAKKTMNIAQKLYEGIKINKNQITGLITYMRTDSTYIVPKIIDDIRAFVKKKWGDKFLPDKKNIYKKGTNSQEAHEAIRPIDINLTPEDVKNYLDEDQMKLYTLIWNNTVASQMANCEIENTSVNIGDNDKKINLSASGSVIKFIGFRIIYKYIDTKEPENIMPELKQNDNLQINQVNLKQHFTQPPARYSEASLVKKMEEINIGRPSTYVPTLTIIQSRSYVYLEKGRFIPETRGYILAAFLEQYFNQYVEYDFTANMEQDLDGIIKQKVQWKDIVKKFWTELTDQVKTTDKITTREIIDNLNNCLNKYLFHDNPERKCPSCSDNTLSLKTSKNGAFIGCSKYPDCKYAQPISMNQDEDCVKPIHNDKVLGKDNETGCDIILKNGPYGWYVEKDNEKKKRMAVPKNINPDDMDLKQAEFLLQLPLLIGQHPDDKLDIKMSIGRFGPYLIYNEQFISLKKFSFDITLEDALQLIEANSHKVVVVGKHPKDKKNIFVKKSRFGWYLQHGKKKIKVTEKEKTITLEDALVKLNKK